MAKFYLFITLISLHWDRIILDGYYCVYDPDLFLKPLGCKQYMCWESQLTDRNRETLTTILNNYRSDVALGIHPAFKGSLYHPMFQLDYDFSVELQCIEWFRKLPCVLPLSRNLTLPDTPARWRKENDYLFSWKGTIQSFKLEYNDFQDDVIHRIEDILLREERANSFMNSWTESGTYKYGIHTSYGCAVLITNNMTGETDFGGTATNDRVALVACLFLGFLLKDTDLHQKIEAEPLQTLPSDKCIAFAFDSIKFDPETGLCKSEIGDDLKPCQIYYNNDQLEIRHKCAGEVPLYWKTLVRPNNKYTQIVIRYSYNLILKPVILINLQSPPLTTKIPVTARTTEIITTTTPSITPSTTSILTNPYIDDNLSDNYCDDLSSLYCTPPLLIFIILCVITFLSLYVLFKVYSVRFQR